MKPLQNMQDVVKGGIVNTIDWAYGPMAQTFGKNKQAGKTDTVFQKVPLNTLRRAAYNSVFSTLFQSADQFPFVNADKTLKKVIDKLSVLMFPKGTTFTHDDESTSELLQKILKDTKFQLKTEAIINEAALMGYCGIRSVYNQELGRWLYEIKPREYLIIETMEGIPDEITALGLEWPIERNKKIYWKKERWTTTEFQEWPEKLEKNTGEKPEFKPEEAITTPHFYGEIPMSIVPHIYDSCEHGIGICNEEEILSVKSLIRLRHKRHFGHLKYMDPNPVRKNHQTPGEAMEMGIGNVLDIVQADQNAPVDLSLLEFAGMPESVKDEFSDLVKALYEAAGLKAPPPDEMNKPGVEKSGVALRLVDKDDAKTIETLRDNGYSEVVKHFEKILRMGKSLNLPDYAQINPADPYTYTVAVKYPDFFPPTDDEIATKINNMNAAELPPVLMGPMVAALFGIEDQASIDLIIQSLEDKKELEKPTPLDMGA